MYREIRRIEKKMEQEKIIDILKNSDYGVLSVIGDDEFPYGVPLNYYYEDGIIYFHCANSGHKIDAILKHSKVSFCIVEGYEIIPKELNAHFSSAIIFGIASILHGKEKSEFLRKLGLKYSFNFKEIVDNGIDESIDQTTMVAIKIKHMSGKGTK